MTKTPSRLTKNMYGILLALAQGNTLLTTISSAAKKDPSNARRALITLESKGYVSFEKATKTYSFTHTGSQVLLQKLPQITTDQKKLEQGTSDQRSDQSSYSVTKRGHNIRIKYTLASSPKGWKESRKQFFSTQQIIWEPLHLKNVDGVQFTLQDIHCKAMASSILAIPKALSLEMSQEMMASFIENALSFIPHLERKFPGLRVNPMPTILWGEIAHEQDVVARLKDTYTVIRHTDTKIRVLIDHSPGQDGRKGVEIEFLHPGLFDEDSETWERRIIQILSSPYDYDVMGMKVEQEEFRNDDQDNRLERIERIVEKNSLQIQDVTIISKAEAEKMGYYATNIRSHTESIIDMGGGIKKFNVLISELRETMYHLVLEIRELRKK